MCESLRSAPLSLSLNKTAARFASSLAAQPGCVPHFKSSGAQTESSGADSFLPLLSLSVCVPSLGANQNVCPNQFSAYVPILLPKMSSGQDLIAEYILSRAQIKAPPHVRDRVSAQHKMRQRVQSWGRDERGGVGGPQLRRIATNPTHLRRLSESNLRSSGVIVKTRVAAGVPASLSLPLSRVPPPPQESLLSQFKTSISCVLSPLL